MSQEPASPQLGCLGDDKQGPILLVRTVTCPGSHSLGTLGWGLFVFLLQWLFRVEGPTSV